MDSLLLIDAFRAFLAPISLASLLYLGLITVFSFLSLMRGPLGTRARKVLAMLTRRPSDPSG